MIAYRAGHMGSVITGTGIALPDQIVSNEDLKAVMDTDNEWVESRTGVRERRIAPPGMATSDLGIDAGAAALADAGLAASDVDALVVATMTPDFYAPGPAPLVQHGMGLRRDIPAYCIRQQCSGFLYGLDLADSLIASGKADTALVIGAEVHAGVQPWITAWDRLQSGGEGPTDDEYDLATRNRAWAVLFGDGAGAAVLQRRDSDDGVLATKLYTDGEHFRLIHIGALGSKARPFVDVEQVESEAHIPQMQGPLLYRQAVRLMPAAVADLLDANGYTLDDLDMVVAHQANERILDGVRRKLGVDSALVPSNISSYGNTTAATLPILYHELRKAGQIESGDLVAFVAFGAGAHWGAALHREA